MRRLRTAAAVLLLTLAVRPATALEPEEHEAVVMHNRVFDGEGYAETFLPSDGGSLLLLAGGDSAVRFVRTLEYFWPLSRQRYVSFRSRYEVVEGDLKLEGPDGTVAVVPADVFAIRYPRGAVNGGGEMLWGRAALEAFREHRAGEQAFRRALAAADGDRARYLRDLKAAAAERVRTGTAPLVRPPAAAPEPSLANVTEPSPGYRIAMPAGRYVISLVRDGGEVAGTRRAMEVIEPLAGRATVAEVVPEERWTRPIASDQPSDRIFAAPGTTVFLVLKDAALFDDAEYARLMDPQAVGVAGRPLWVRRGPSAVDRVGVSWDGAAEATVPRADYKSEQTQGDSLGYRIRRAENGETPDVAAFAIDVPRDGSARARVSAPAGDAGGFEREIVVVGPSSPVLVWGSALLPLAGWAVRRMSARRGATRRA